jgi:hypothetical protein
MSDSQHDIVRTLGTAAMKSSWPVGVTVWVWMGQNLPTVVGLATLTYLVLQSVLIVLRIREQFRRTHEAERRSGRTSSDE